MNLTPFDQGSRVPTSKENEKPSDCYLHRFERSVTRSIVVSTGETQGTVYVFLGRDTSKLHKDKSGTK